MDKPWEALDDEMMPHIPTEKLSSLMMACAVELTKRPGYIGGGKIESSVDSELAGYKNIGADTNVAQHRPGPTIRLKVDIRFNREALRGED